MENLETFGRRAFLGRMTVTAGGAVIASLLPASLLQAAQSCAVGAQVVHADPCGDWQLDDMCTAYPPYTFREHHGYARHVPLHGLAADIDRDWVG